jgi:hypothetical protein
VRLPARLVGAGGAPLTFSWLGVLLATTLFQHTLTGPKLRDVLLQGSTNLHHLTADPMQVLQVLLSSLLWIDGYYWWPYAIVFCLILAPAERWLGQLRWFAVGLLAHVTATYVSQGFLWVQIQEAAASERLADARDIGVSYFVAGVAGVLTYRIARPWRWLYLGATLLMAGLPLALNPGFTPLGHFCALLVGLACYPLVRRLRTCGPERL